MIKSLTRADKKRKKKHEIDETTTLARENIFLLFVIRKNKIVADAKLNYKRVMCKHRHLRKY